MNNETNGFQIKDILMIFSWAIGFLTAIFAEPVRKALFKAKLSCVFTDDRSCLTETPTSGGGRAKYIRCKIENTSRTVAKDCRAYLINIEKKENNIFHPTSYCDSIPLAWSCQAEKPYQGLVIHKGVTQFIDIFVVRPGSPRFEPQIMITPFRYQDEIFNGTGTYRFTFQIVADGANTLISTLSFDWNGNWQEINVYQ